MNRMRRYTALALAVLFLLLPLASCGKKNEKAVGACGDYEILYEEVRYEVLTYRHKHPDCTEEELRAAVEQAIRERYAVAVLCAQYVPASSMDSDVLIERSENDIENLISSLGGKSDYKQYLKEMYATEHLFELLMILALMQQDLESTVFRQTELEHAEALLNWWREGNCVQATKLIFADRQAADAARALIDGTTPLESLLAQDAFATATVEPSTYYFRDLRGTPEETLALTLDGVGSATFVAESDGEAYFFVCEKENDYDVLVYQAPSALSIYRENRISEMITAAASELSLTWYDTLDERLSDIG